jgi:hypothetical protein
MSWLPTYYKFRFDVSLEEIGIFSSIPVIVYLVILLVAGLAADILFKQAICSKLFIRRAFQSTAFICNLVALFILSFANLNLIQTIVMIVLSMAAVGFSTGTGKSTCH